MKFVATALMGALASAKLMDKDIVGEVKWTGQEPMESNEKFGLMGTYGCVADDEGMMYLILTMTSTGPKYFTDNVT